MFFHDLRFCAGAFVGAFAVASPGYALRSQELAARAWARGVFGAADRISSTVSGSESRAKTAVHNAGDPTYRAQAERVFPLWCPCELEG
jgi:hypothetical protein